MSQDAHGHILVVDDEKQLLTALCRLLQLHGYTTTGAESGRQALEILRAAESAGSATFDVLVTDLKMPEMDGISLIRAAFDIDRTLVSVVMTGHGTIDTAVEAMKSGAVDYLLKPFNLSVAIPVLSRAVAIRRLRVENATLNKQVATHTTVLEASKLRLELANEDIEAYNNAVSRDFRGRLGAMIDCAKLLRDESNGPLNEKQRELSEFLLCGGELLLRLTDDLLNFARLRQQPMLKTHVSVTPLVREVFDDLRKECPERVCELRLADLPDVVADRSLLKHVFVTLLLNAVTYSRHIPRPIIEVEGHREADECTYSIAGNPGEDEVTGEHRTVDPAEQCRCHEGFDGTGVGLSIVQRIVERHGGRLTVETGSATGARFTVSFPEIGTPAGPSREKDDVSQ